MCTRNTLASWHRCGDSEAGLKSAACVSYCASRRTSAACEERASVTQFPGEVLQSALDKIVRKTAGGRRRRKKLQEARDQNAVSRLTKLKSICSMSKRMYSVMGQPRRPIPQLRERSLNIVAAIRHEKPERKKSAETRAASRVRSSCTAVFPDATHRRPEFAHGRRRASIVRRSYSGYQEKETGWKPTLSTNAELTEEYDGALFEPRYR